MAREIAAYSLEGGMNSDVALDKMPPGDYLYALNIDNGSTGVGEVGLITNIRGNTLVDVTMPAGDNKTIGTCKDEKNNKLYYFVYNSLGNHTIVRYDYSANALKILLEGPFLNFHPEHLILHADMAEGRLMYWVDGYNEARKINVDKLENGTYGALDPQYLNAYKRAPGMPVIATYLTDTTKSTNFIYRSLFKFVYRFTYDDGEKSNFSDFSKVPIPLNEGIRSGDQVTNENNCISLLLETGSPLVKLIEIGMQRNNQDFVSIAILNKAKLNIPDHTLYEYKFYNDGSTSGLDKDKVNRPYNFLPDKPRTQKFVHNAIVYGHFSEGFEDVAVQLQGQVTQVNYDFDIDIEEKHNNPTISHEDIDAYYEGGGLFGGGYRHVIMKITIGEDVKKGNVFTFEGTNNKYMRINFKYTATEFDDAYSIANRLLNSILTWPSNRVNAPLALDGAGNASFRVDISQQADNYFKVTKATAISTMVTTSITGSVKALKTIKNGSTIGYGIVYEDADGRQSSVYTSDEWLLRTPFITQSGYLKVTTHKLTINHRPPVWAARYQIVRTADLVYNSYIQMLIQRAILVNETDQSEYYDLAVGSLITYNKIHENSVLSYEFKKGDRIRLITRDTGAYYPFYETEVLSYKESTEEVIDQTIIANKTDTVTLETAADESNIGRTIKIGEERREIIGATGNTYLLSAKITGDETFASFTLYDFRGVLRIKKPDNFEITDLSMVEVYNPVFSNADSNRPYYACGEKHNIINPGQATRAHSANGQNQSGSTPAIINISSGDAYIKAREMPTTNKIPGAQTKIVFVEDSNLSDFYLSDLTDLGKAYLIDNNPGIKYFPARLRTSGNFIEGTQVNGLNDFNNEDRVDLNDSYGAIKLLKYVAKRLYVFKDLRTGWMDVYATRITGQGKGEITADSAKLLSNIQYFAWQGGIGDNPESFASRGFRIFFASAKSGVIIRLSVDGETPISEVFGMDKAIKLRLQKSIKDRTRIFGGFEDLRKQYVIKFQQKFGEPDIENTVAFKEGKKRWVSYYSYAPEMMEDFLTEFISFKNGKLWIHNTNEKYNNFYGQQYVSKIHVVANQKYQVHKLYYGLKIDSNSRWRVPLMITDKNEKFPNGTRSRLTPNNFIQEDGKYYADILKDIGDPRFTNTAQALHEGREVQGSYMTLQLENENINEINLKDVYLYSEEQARNF